MGPRAAQCGLGHVDLRGEPLPFEPQRVRVFVQSIELGAEQGGVRHRIPRGVGNRAEAVQRFSRFTGFGGDLSNVGESAPQLPDLARQGADDQAEVLDEAAQATHLVIRVGGGDREARSWCRRPMPAEPGHPVASALSSRPSRRDQS